MNLLSDVLTYIRRIIKSPSNAQITDALLIDYVNRFWIMDVDARIQLFDLKTKYQFQTIPGFDQYNMPVYNIQTETDGTTTQNINFYPVYQGFMNPCYINGVQVPLHIEKSTFFNIWPNVVQQMVQVDTGDGSTAEFTFTLPLTPNFTTPVSPPYQYFLRGHVDMAGVIATGSNTDPIFGSTINTAIPSTSIYPAVYITSVDANSNSLVVQDSGQFLIQSGNRPNYGLLMKPGNAPFGYSALAGGYSTVKNTINYMTGECNLTFSSAPADGAPINVQAYLFQSGLPRGILFNNNTITLRSPPDQQYLVEMDAYLTPSAFMTTSAAIPFAYMSEYIARGAARKILADTGDWEQFDRYEPLFLEQEQLVWKRSQRQITATRTQTIYSQGTNMGQQGSSSLGGQTN